MRMDLKEVGWEGVDRKHLAQEGVQCRAVVKTVMNLDQLSDRRLLYRAMMLGS
jgi:hypothetical protein